MKKQRTLIVVLSLLVLAFGMMCSNPLTTLREKATQISQIEGTISEMAATLTAQVPALMTQVAAQATEISAQDTQVPTPSEQVPAQTGSITGKLSYPSDHIPPLRIVAFEVVEGSMTGNWYVIETELNQATYQIDNLPTGTYYVVAYIQETDQLRAGYTHAVPCGLSVDCNDHALIPVEVNTGTTTEGIDPGDWYAEPENYPPDPTAP